MTVILIAAVGRNGVIGVGNGLPWRIPEDLRRFKQLTLGHTLLMGRKTYDSIGRPLPGRRTVVITRQPGWSADGVEVAHSLGSAFGLAGDNDLYVAGGGEIYRQALPLADRLELTEVDQAPAGDVTFPPFDRDEWLESARDDRAGFSFVGYARRGPGRTAPAAGESR